MGARYDAKDLVAFDNAAAGHEGVMSDESGSVVIKPCTEAEVKFYESATAQHPAFAAYMPTFMGTLAVAPPGMAEQVNPSAGNAPAACQESNSASAILPESGVSQQTLAESAVSVPAQSLQPSTSSQKTGSGEEYGPSHGKHLESNMSIVLSNATASFTRPNVLDLKLGAKLWDDAAPPEKRARLDKVSSESTSSSLGFRIAGMKVWEDGEQSQNSAPRQNERKDKYKVYGKMYGRELTKENVTKGFEDYFAFVPTSVRKQVISRIFTQVSGIRAMLEAEESRMVGASILAVVEGDASALKKALEQEKRSAALSGSIQEDEDGEDDEVPKAYEVKLIDFAHAKWTPGEGPDQNALQGVQSIERILFSLTN